MLLDRARALAGDHDSGAAELLARLLPLLDDAIALGDPTPLELARIVLRGQPGMAPLWHACAAAVNERVAAGSFARARAEFERAPRALVRAASAALEELVGEDGNSLILTLSYSSGVCETLKAVASRRGIRTVCGEGRPRLEGRRLAAALTQAGADVTLVVDAAVTTYLREATAVVLGADAVGAVTWTNKVGSFGLSAAAGLSGVPVYVIAGRHKLTPAALVPELRSTEGPLDEVAPTSTGWSRRNPYFEQVPVELVTLFLTDLGRLTPRDLREACERGSAQLAKLIQYMSEISS